MAPKRKAAQAPSASQPLPSTSTRNTRKRRLSDPVSEISVASERPSSSQGSKRRKKAGRVAAASVEPEVIVEEQEQEEAGLVHHHQDAMDMQLGGDATYDRDMPEVVVEDTIEVFQPRSKHVHFGGGAREDDDDEIEPRQTATNITPHPRKTSVKHRMTMSPMPGVGGSSRRVTTSTRSSLPPAWSQDSAAAEPTKIIQELQFVPLREALNDRVKRRLRRSHLSEEQIAIEDEDKTHKRTSLELNQLQTTTAEKEARIAAMEAQLQELTLELETQRQLSIGVADDVDAQQQVLLLKQQLQEMRRELPEHVHEHHRDDEPDDNMLVFDSQKDIQEVAYPQLPAAHGATNGHRTITDIDVKHTRHESGSFMRSLFAS